MKGYFRAADVAGAINTAGDVNAITLCDFLFPNQPAGVRFSAKKLAKNVKPRRVRHGGGTCYGRSRTSMTR